MKFYLNSPKQLEYFLQIIFYNTLSNLENLICISVIVFFLLLMSKNILNLATHTNKKSLKSFIQYKK